MARGVSKKLQAAIPPDYSVGWYDVIDRRTKVWHAILPRNAALKADAGGAENLSHAKRSLIRRAVFLELLTETQELRFTRGEAVDIGAYTQALNSLLGVYRLLGVERKARPVRRLKDVMEAAA